MNIERTIVANAVVFRVSGTHTIPDTGTLHAHVERALQHGYGHVVLNFEQVVDMGAAGLGELVKIFSVVRACDAQLTLSAVPHRIRYLLAATNLEPLFETVDSDQQAIARAAASGTSRQVA
jgi:anti-anti-sigma factor